MPISKMTLEEVIIHIWDMAIVSVKPGKIPYDANVIRENTLKWASFELNERAELARKAGIREIVEWIKTERRCKYINDVTYYPVYEKALEAKLKEWGISPF